MKKLLIVLLVSSIFLSGCLYPNERLTENQATNQEQLDRIQDAVHDYQESQNGLLPIQTRDQETPLLIKYPIDFNLLRDNNLIGETPGNSFEQGGIYSYVIVKPEDEAIVKVSDTRITQKLRTINYEIQLYRSNNTYPPYGQSLGNGFFTIDTERMNMSEEPVVESPYNGTELDIIMTTEGEAVVDYRSDVYQLLEEEEIDSYDGDLRELLLEYYPIVPTYGTAMILDDGQINLDEQSEDDLDL
ncbi:hypothetical protein [Halalkalibacillus halophilus]|uniref:hypothetical protein n=1 Tax=Halalkalibacillus halophilus TaxID=392827 RepID=UPI000415D23C|nr:hypothetical protein [Halalkalibacillus halophilus]